MICRYLPYTLTLHAPAVLTALGGDRNSSRTMPFIPGAAVRGAVARKLGDPGDDPARQAIFRELVLVGVRFLNAYPRAGGRRSLPTPVSLKVDRDAPLLSTGELVAWDLAALDSQSDDGWPEASLTEMAEPFVSIGAAQPIRVSPVRGSRVHQQRDRGVGRAWTDPKTEEAHGTIFAFEFLEAGQEFDGVIQIRGESEGACNTLATRVKDALRGRVLVGRSRRGGYGGDATIAWSEPINWEVLGQGVRTSDVPEGAEFRALLVSTYVGRDSDSGQFDPAYLAQEIVERLSGRVEVVRRRWSFERVGGFNRKWRLELPQALGCAGGSVLVLKAAAPIPVADLLAVEQDGLGERRTEGFGRVVFLDAPAPRSTFRPATADKPKAPTVSAPDLVRFAEDRILVASVHRVIQEEAVRLAEGVKSPPSSSLVGRLRNALRAHSESPLATLQTWLTRDESSNTALKRPAMDQLDRCRLRDGQRLSEWLRAMARGSDVSPTLRLDTIALRRHLISQATARQAIGSRDAEIRAHFIDAVLAALSHRLRQRSVS